MPSLPLPPGCPIPGAQGFQQPSGSGAVGVMILGEAMGDQELAEGRGFVEWAPAGSVLERAIRRLGMRREQFVLWNVVPTHPPKNFLEGAPWEHAAVEWGRAHLAAMVDLYKPRCILALGGVATRAATGLAGPKLGVSQLSGFVLPGLYAPVVPFFHPSYLRRGAMSLFGYFMKAILEAVKVARGDVKASVPDPERPPAGYLMRPSEAAANAYLAPRADASLAYDIETPYSTEEDAAEEAEGEHAIKSIQFSWGAQEGVFLPWREPFISIAKRALAYPCRKLGWNNWRFDDPVLRANGAVIGGEIHDLMWAWHHSQPDLPRGLQFAAAQQGWPWPWKHLDAASPEFYGIVDVDVLQWMVA